MANRSRTLLKSIAGQTARQAVHGSRSGWFQNMTGTLARIFLILLLLSIGFLWWIGVLGDIGAAIRNEIEAWRISSEAEVIAANAQKLAAEAQVEAATRSDEMQTLITDTTQLMIGMATAPRDDDLLPFNPFQQVINENSTKFQQDSEDYDPVFVTRMICYRDGLNTALRQALSGPPDQSAEETNEIILSGFDAVAVECNPGDPERATRHAAIFRDETWPDILSRASQ